ncbi:hypothetical protein F0M18_01205 [Pseudohalioglobus sediminis]|uniref:tRNA_anti-like n=1 Tax=Pseudohalioglobus sediminis TaxID=2606449 RepID=A0A5B0X402_9GAMM|nr:hypothetical protein [Pseudohalioglobus sediminis]KAA1194090.1 hypothetical protein F0M18_01205 [Pseudohalioglobus sediminis]
MPWWESLLFITVAIGGFVAYGYWSTHGGEPDYTMTAQQLAAEYQQNEVQAHGKYAGKTVRVTGAYMTSGVSLGAPWVILDAKREGLIGVSGVQCHFGRGDAASLPRFKEGQRVSVTGEVAEKMMYVQLMDCEL